MHSAVQQNKKYIQYASQNTVEVQVMSGIEGGVQRKDRKAATYAGVDAEGREVQYLVEFPGLTVEALQAMNRSKAASYNGSGAIPHTAFVDPFTLQKLDGIRGGASAGQVIDRADEARKAIRKRNGNAKFTRKDLAKIDATSAKVAKELASRRLDKALSALEKIESSAKSWPELAQKRVAALRERVLDNAERAIADFETLAETKPKLAKTKLAVLRSRLRGTRLEARIQALLATLKAK